ncbi:hypothetical protein [Ralstonia pseudosolanacearum]|uniref:Uncharacterized protein n=1 Tax=Ralstonia pseudosolanacearum TaxID=1310165 RepID=A0A454TM44_9RALS|nr:hypothetical protein [Ralstonia pseudosolanacearum]RNM03213.1 hypothetical protein EGA29_19190 [Ralstonia pseudosolanacearum]
MNHQKALPILQALARGIDPETGEVLVDQSPFNNVLVIRALQCAIDSLGQKSAKGRSTERPKNAGRAWLEEEDRQLVRAFDAGMDPKELATQHGRTRGAINSRLVRLGRLSA